MAIEKFDLVLQESYKITPNVLHMVFTRADGKCLEYIPGQFITFMLQVDGQLKRRSYSIASIPGQHDTIDIAVSYVDGGIASELLFNLQPGEQLHAIGPAGKLVIKEDADVKRYVMVATGTGVAPYRSMLPDLGALLAHHHEFQVEILLGVRYQEDLLYAQDFRAFAQAHQRMHFNAYLSREHSTGLAEDEHNGYVQHAFAHMQLNPGSDIIYLCGNPAMIDEAFEHLVGFGFPTSSIRREKYISSN